MTVYYHKKEELFYPIVGEMTVSLADIETKEKEVIKLDAKEHKVVFIPKGLAHRVEANKEGSVLLVVSTYQNSEEDEYSYMIA